MAKPKGKPADSRQARLSKEQKQRLCVWVQRLREAIEAALQVTPPRAWPEFDGAKACGDAAAKLEFALADENETDAAPFRAILDGMRHMHEAGPKEWRAAAEKAVCLCDAVLGAKREPLKLSDRHIPVYLGDCRLRIAGEPLTITEREDSVLSALVSLQAASKSSLESESGYADAVRVLRNLIHRYPALKKSITFPGGKGRGGYRTIIRMAIPYVDNSDTFSNVWK
jgi:hypothetical protein